MKAKNLKIWYGIAVYFAGVFGVLFSKYIPALLQARDLSMIQLVWPTISEMVLSLPLAAIAVTLAENERGLTDEEKAMAEKGKLKRIKKRLINSFVYGMCIFFVLEALLERWTG